jgi:hypothetical protein
MDSPITGNVAVDVRGSRLENAAAHRMLRAAVASPSGKRLLVAMLDKERARRVVKRLVDADLFTSYMLVCDEDSIREVLAKSGGAAFDLVVTDDVLHPTCAVHLTNGSRGRLMLIGDDGTAVQLAQMLLDTAH